MNIPIIALDLTIKATVLLLTTIEDSVPNGNTDKETNNYRCRPCTEDVRPGR